jgi:ubiquinone/menaquinone biosynthesis C-methylase UbiE
MTSIGKVEAYFTGVASTYQAASNSALWSLVRRREAIRLMSLIGDVQGRDVLELGSGAGFYTRMLQERGARHIVAVDLSARMLDELPRHGITPIVGDATRVNPGRKFTHLLSAGMLEFVPRPHDVLANAARFAEPGAVFAILAPSRSLLGRGYKRFHARHGLQIGLFDRDILARLAEGTGWKIDSVQPAGPYSICARLIRSKTV